MCNSPLVRCRTGDREASGSNLAQCIFSAFGNFFVFSFQAFFDKKMKTKE